MKSLLKAVEKKYRIAIDYAEKLPIGFARHTTRYALFSHDRNKNFRALEKSLIFFSYFRILEGMADMLQQSLKEQEEEFQRKDLRYEVCEGVIYGMAPPSADHQIIQHRLTRQLEDFFTGKKCQAFDAPFGVDLTEFTESKKKTALQPDISVVCDPAKLDRRTGTYRGAPALVVEIASPSTVDRDLTEKKALYEKAGVLEYLLVLDRYTANLYTLRDGVYQKTLCEADETGDVSIPVPSFPELTLEIRDDWFWFGR